MRDRGGEETVPWFVVDDAFPDSPKLERMGGDYLDHALGVAAWTLLGADCSKLSRRTGGFVSEMRVAKVLGSWPLNARKRACKALVSSGLWEQVEGGYQFHDWEDWQPSVEELEAKVSSQTERQRRWREKKRLQASTEASTDASTERLPSRADAHACIPLPLPNPTQEDPPKPPSASLGNALEFEVFESFREVHGRLNTTLPKLSQNQRSAAVEHCRDVAKQHGKTLRQAAIAVAEAAVPGSKSWPFEVARVDPYAPSSLGSKPKTSGNWLQIGDWSDVLQRQIADADDVVRHTRKDPSWTRPVE